MARWCDNRRRAPTPICVTSWLWATSTCPSSESDPIFSTLTSRGLELPAHKSAVGGSSLDGHKHYDQVAFFPGETSEFAERVDVFDFDNAVFADLFAERPLEAVSRLRALPPLRPPSSVGPVHDLSPGLSSPVRAIPTDSGEEPEAASALCLSGGGYRAMLFHLGVLWRLREAGWLAAARPRLERLRRLDHRRGPRARAGTTTSRTAVVAPRAARPRAGRNRRLDRGRSRARCCRARSRTRWRGAYREHLFGDAVLRRPARRAPRVRDQRDQRRSRARWRASRAPYVEDWRVGWLPDPDIPLADRGGLLVGVPAGAVAAPAATDGARWVDREGNDLATPEHRDGARALGRRRLRQPRPGDRLEALPHPDRLRRRRPHGRRAAPEGDWPRHMVRVLRVIDNQVRALRKQPGDRGAAQRRARRRVRGHPQRHRRLRPGRGAAGAARADATSSRRCTRA